MWFSASMSSEPQWFANLFEKPLPQSEGEERSIAGRAYVRRKGLLRERALVSSAQKQTEESFGFKWKKRETFESDVALTRTRDWLRQRYGDLAVAGWLKEHGDTPVLLDAGCGAGMSGLLLLKELLGRIRYVGVDISEAVDVAATRFREQDVPGVFFQADIVNLPLKEASLDLIFSEGVLHHTDSTFNALKSLSRLLKPGGRFLFYVYRKKGPIREFTDDLIRHKLSGLSPQQQWETLLPLTRLGKALGELKAAIDVPQNIELLGIPKGPIDVQRLFYWHVFKAFYRDDYSLEEMNHINFDWYAPVNAHRQTLEEVRGWCASCGLEIEREVEEDAGITIIARRSR